jgi:holo-[acyl-carrier protein] synthase
MVIYNQNTTDRFIAGRFAAKEAALKCLGTGMQNGISLQEVSVVRSENGQPLINLTGAVKIIADNLGIRKWHISISHAPSHSTAFVVAET